MIVVKTPNFYLLILRKVYVIYGKSAQTDCQSFVVDVFDCEENLDEVLQNTLLIQPLPNHLFKCATLAVFFHYNHLARPLCHILHPHRVRKG